MGVGPSRRRLVVSAIPEGRTWCDSRHVITSDEGHLPAALKEPTGWDTPIDDGSRATSESGRSDLLPIVRSSCSGC